MEFKKNCSQNPVFAYDDVHYLTFSEILAKSKSVYKSYFKLAVFFPLICYCSSHPPPNDNLSGFCCPTYQTEASSIK